MFMERIALFELATYDFHEIIVQQELLQNTFYSISVIELNFSIQNLISEIFMQNIRKTYSQSLFI